MILGIDVSTYFEEEKAHAKYYDNGKWEKFPCLFKGKVPELPVDFDNQIRNIRNV